MRPITRTDRDGYVLTNVSLVINAYAVGGLQAVAQMARARGDARGAAALTSTADNITRAVNQLLWDPLRGVYRDGLDASGNPLQHASWHASVFAAAFGLVPASRWPALLRYFRQRGMVGSVYASFWYLAALYQAPDHGQLALETLTSCAKHSWCHMLERGATATMEAWDVDEKPNLSWSHPWASAPASAVTWGLFGVRPLTAGWQRIQVRPRPGNLTWARVRVPSRPGRIDVAFTRVVAAAEQQHGQFNLTVSAPAGVHVTACVPTLGLPGATVDVDGAPTLGKLDDAGFVCVALARDGASHTVVRGRHTSAS